MKRESNLHRYLWMFVGMAVLCVCSIQAPAAEIIHFGTLIDDGGFLFDSFGDTANATSHGANFAGDAATWYGVTMTNDLTGAANGISWSGTAASTTIYDYTGIYSGTPGAAADANAMTNTGIHTGPAVNITAIAGRTYTVDLLFANAFSERNFDITVDGTLFADNLALLLEGTGTRRPLVYRFNVTADNDGIDIVFSNGSDSTDTNPYVNALMVTQIPTPAALPAGLGLLAQLVCRRRRV